MTFLTTTLDRVATEARERILINSKGYEFDWHDGLAVGVRQTVAMLRRYAEWYFVCTEDSLETLYRWFKYQRHNVCRLALKLPARDNYFCRVEERPMFIDYSADEEFLQEAVHLGRLLVLGVLAEIYRGQRREYMPLDEIHVEIVGMLVYDWLEPVAQRQLHPSNFAVWQIQWCQIGGEQPWVLSHRGSEALYYRSEIGWHHDCDLQRLV
ncbi:MAG: hypothetical protein RI947_1408 [Candidatus Parcubacteria bacterium]